MPDSGLWLAHLTVLLRAARQVRNASLGLLYRFRPVLRGYPDGADVDIVSCAITVNKDVVPMPMFAMPSVRNLSLLNVNPDKIGKI